MKLFKCISLALAAACVLAACSTVPAEEPVPTVVLPEQSIDIALRDDGITVDGQPASSSADAAVYTANDIVYYEAGKDFTYGEGTQADAHTPEEAAAHTVVHITQPGAYTLSGKLSAGQIAVDLGEDAQDDPKAVVTLVLQGVDITCQVAPAVIFYNVYECGDKDNPTKDVDTSAAGANVIIADGTENSVTGSYVARIYKPDSVELSEDGTQVTDSKKLHKYDGAFYSKMSMNIYGGTGSLSIQAANEGLDSELHLSIHGGNISIDSGNDGINTNEDGVSVTTVNGGNLTITVNGQTGEGDGIDSNGWLVINGGKVIAAACDKSGDAGIDSDMGIHINGGTVIAGGNMLDRIEDGGQTYAVLRFASQQQAGKLLEMKDKKGSTVFSATPANGYSILVYSSPSLKEGTYTLYSDGAQLAGQVGGFGGGMGGFGGGMRPDGERPQDGEGFQKPEGGDLTPPDGTRPTGDFDPTDGTRPTGDFDPTDGTRPTRPEGAGERPQGGKGDRPGFGTTGEAVTEFALVSGGNTVSNLRPAQS